MGRYLRPNMTPKDDVHIYELRDVEQLTYAEISARTGWSQQSIRRALRREHGRQNPSEPFRPERLGQVLTAERRYRKAYRLCKNGRPSREVMRVVGFTNLTTFRHRLGMFRRKHGLPRLSDALPDSGETVVGLHPVHRGKRKNPRIQLSGKALRRAGLRNGKKLRWDIVDSGITLQPADKLDQRVKWLRNRGIVTVCQHGGSMCLTLIGPVKCLRWRVGDRVTWSIVRPKVLRLTLVPAKKANIFDE